MAIYVFDQDYELDLQRYELRYAGKSVKLEPQVFDVLVYLIQHRDRVVSKDELLEQLWSGRIVSEATLTSRIKAVRQAIGDRGRQQRLIKTLHGRGYRFIGEVQEEGNEPVVHAGSPPLSEAIPAVGRDVELRRLQGGLDKALQGGRQTVFVTGEAGLGKTTLVDAFIHEARAHESLWIGRGQCLEHYGVGEAYMPVLEALGQLCRKPEGHVLISILARMAPTWLVQMPWLVDDGTFETLQRRVVGATPHRMLREMAEAIEVLTAERPLLLVLEDLHWSDYATLDLVTLLGQRRETARFLLLGTFRSEVIKAGGHPLQAVIRTLHRQQRCEEVALAALTPADVAAYLTTRFAHEDLAAALGPVLCQRTDGNPLFMVNMVEHWLGQGWIYQQADHWQLRPGWEAMAQEIPVTLQELVMERSAMLSPTEQRLLEVASVAGVEFSAASVAVALDDDVEATEAQCEELARRGQFLQSYGMETWPDGTVASRYRFLHTLYQNIAYERLPAARRTRFHQRIAAREEAGYGERRGEIAARLAMHFERGHLLPKAIAYYDQAARQVLRRSGYAEAIGHLSRGLELVRQLPEDRQRPETELTLQIALASALSTTRGWAVPEVEQAYARAYELCDQLTDPPQLFPVLYGLYELHEYRGMFEKSHVFGEQLLQLADRREDALLRLASHETLACALLHIGDFEQTLQHTAQGLTLYDQQQHRTLVSLYGRDLGVTCRFWSATAQWFLGYPTKALASMHEALAIAQELGHPYSLAAAFNRGALLGQCCGDRQLTSEWAEAASALADAHGLRVHIAMGAIMRGWVLAMEGRGAEGIVHIQRGLDLSRAMGREMDRPYFLALLAESYGSIGAVEEGLGAVREALAALRPGRNFFYEAELHRLRGELLLQRTMPDDQQAESCFQQALAVARRQQAKSLELRAALSLGRLWQRRGEDRIARECLAEVYGWFSEGFETIDLQEAGRLLATLRG